MCGWYKGKVARGRCVFLVELYFVAVVRVVVVVGCSSRSKFAESDDVCGWLVGGEVLELLLRRHCCCCCFVRKGIFVFRRTTQGARRERGSKSVSELTEKV